MRALVVYESMYGNTHAVAEHLAEGLRPTFDTTVVAARDAGREVPATFDLVVVGAPTHAHSMPRAATRRAAVDAARGKGLALDRAAAGPGVREWLATADAAPKAAAVAFDTRIKLPTSLTGRAARRIMRYLCRQGFAPVTDAGSFFVDKDNHLLDGEAERATSWAVHFVKQH